MFRFIAWLCITIVFVAVPGIVLYKFEMPWWFVTGFCGVVLYCCIKIYSLDRYNRKIRKELEDEREIDG